MNFINKCFSFHAEVYRKIFINLKFFIFLCLFYLLTDILKFYQPILFNGFKSGEINFIDSLINLALGSLMVVTYLSYSSLWAVYFKRNESFGVKLKSFFGVLFNYRMYVIYLMFVIIIIVGLSLSLRFIPEVNALLSEVLRIFTSKENELLPDSDKIEIVLNSKEILTIYESITIYQKIASVTTFLTSVVASYLVFIFGLPLVIMDKSNKAFKSMKKSILCSLKNIPLLILTVFAFFIFMNFIGTLVSEIDYLNRMTPLILNAVFFFYIIIGLERFVLTNDKNSV